jgi:hypothetical protein
MKNSAVNMLRVIQWYLREKILILFTRIHLELIKQTKLWIPDALADVFSEIPGMEKSFFFSEQSETKDVHLLEV